MKMAKAEYRSAIRSRKLIMEAFVDLLSEKPLDKITVTDVVNRAQINRGTFYAHYRDIPDVLDHLIHQMFIQIQESLAEGQSLYDIPKVMLERIQELLERDLYFYKKVMNSSASSVMQERLLSVVLDYMLQHEDDFRIGSHEQYVLSIRFCAGGLSNLYRDWFAGKLSFSLNELTQQAGLLIDKVIAAQ